MKTFGYRAPSPEVPQVEVPVGATCYLCEKVIWGRDVGVVLPFAGDPPEMVAHLDCFKKALGVVK